MIFTVKSNPPKVSFLFIKTTTYQGTDSHIIYLVLLFLITGGLPHWINEVPGMEVRTNNTEWEKEMSRFFKDMVSLAKPYLADNGGPIILSQVENEFWHRNPEYVDWCGKLVAEVNVGIPFFMCNGFSANNTLNSINGNDGAAKVADQVTMYPKQPLSWTENEGWYQEWEIAPFSPTYDNRTATEMAFVIAKWFARGAAHHNYYMWYGGNNYGRYAAGQCITNMYAAGTNILFDGHYNEPKKSHLKHLHETIAKYSSDLLNYPRQIFNNKTVYVLDTSTNKFVPATQQYAWVYGTSDSGIAFIENVQNSTATVMYEKHQYNINASSVLLIDLMTMKVVYDTANVSTRNLPSERVYRSANVILEWKKWEEPILTDLSMSYKVFGYPVEQLYITNDLTDYLFYETNISEFWGVNVPLTINSQTANSFAVYVDGVFQSRIDECGQHRDSGDKTYTLRLNIYSYDIHRITILSTSLGVATRITTPGGYSLKGIIGNVSLSIKDITKSKWIHRKYLQGELMSIYTVEGTSKVNWTNVTTANSHAPVWYRTYFDRPSIPAGYTLLLDMKGMGRGYFFINGMNMGRYWLNMVDGEYVQRYYYIPESVLMEKGNLLVLVEDMVSDPPNIQLTLSTMTSYDEK